MTMIWHPIVQDDRINEAPLLKLLAAVEMGNSNVLAEANTRELTTPKLLVETLFGNAHTTAVCVLNDQKQTP